MNGLAKLYHWCQNNMQKGYNGGGVKSTCLFFKDASLFFDVFSNLHQSFS